MGERVLIRAGLMGRKCRFKRVSPLLLVFLTVFLSIPSGCVSPITKPTEAVPAEGETLIKLPEPDYDSEFSLEKSLRERRSIREYTATLLEFKELSQLLWATQGITNEFDFRTAPSAGALYPLELYVAVGSVRGLTPGIYKYQPKEHAVIRVVAGDKRGELTRAALDQSFVAESAVNFIITAVYERTTRKYGERGVRYVHMEVGHAAENLLLQATALGLGAVTIGAFHDGEVSKILGLRRSEAPLYIISVGRKQ